MVEAVAVDSTGTVLAVCVANGVQVTCVLCVIRVESQTPPSASFHTVRVCSRVGNLSSTKGYDRVLKS